MVIDPHPYGARIFSLGEEQAEPELERLRRRMQDQAVGFSTPTANGGTAVVVQSETAHELEVGRAELNRRERRARARAERRAARAARR